MDEPLAASSSPLIEGHGGRRHSVLLTNFIAPYRLPLFKLLQIKLNGLTVLVSTTMEKDRRWAPEFGDLDVVIQKTLTLARSSRHPNGFVEDLSVHIPYDTISQLQQMRPSVVVSGELGMRTFQALLYRKLHPQSRLIVWATLSEATEQGRGMIRGYLRRWILPRADAVLVNGNSGARYVKELGAADGRVFVVPQTVEVSRFSAVPLQRADETSRRLLCVGRLIERKGLTQFLGVISERAKGFPDRKIELWFVGDGPMRTALEGIVVPSNLRLRFWGNVDYDQLPNFYRDAGILVFPTLADEWGLVVNEAMAAGLPVLGSLYSQAVEELVENGVNGWTFRPDRKDEFYDAVDRALMTSEQQLASMRLAARKRIMALTPECVADKIVQAVHFVTGNKTCERL